MPKEFSRSRRVEEQLKRVLAELIRREVKDPRLGPVTVTAVEVSKYLGHARVYVTPFAGLGDAAHVIETLQHAAGYLRHELRKAMTLRVTPELDFRLDEGAALTADVLTIVTFATEGRANKEQGSEQMWGRVAGFPSSANTVQWAAAEFRKAGITDVRVQPIAQDPKGLFWMPRSWEVRLLADPAFGPGSTDVVLESALPLSPSNIPSGTLTAPLVHVGTASPSVAHHIDVKGKIAVQLVVPQGHMLFERGAVDARAADVTKRGAVGVFNLVRPARQRALVRLQQLRQSLLQPGPW